MRSLLLGATDDTIVVAHEASPSKPVEYLGETVLDSGYWAVWFLFKDQPFDVARFYRPDGPLDGVLRRRPRAGAVEGLGSNNDRADHRSLPRSLIAPDGRYLVLDEDEFEEAVSRGRVTSSQIVHARGVLQQLVEATERGEFPPAVVKAFKA